jgi:hypothetical protein
MTNWLFNISGYISALIGALVGIIYVWLSQRHLKIICSQLGESSAAGLLEKDQLRFLLLKQTFIKFAIFIAVTVACVLIINADLFMFCLGVVFGLTAYVAINLNQ